jgi:hypothetical protein
MTEREIFPWEETFGTAASNGNVDNMKWLKANDCPRNKTEDTKTNFLVQQNMELLNVRSG